MLIAVGPDLPNLQTRRDSVQPINRPANKASSNPPAASSLFPSKVAPKLSPSEVSAKPGLSLPQDFPPLAAAQPPPPAPPRPQRKVVNNAAIKPVVPVLPTSSSKVASTQKDLPHPEQANSTEVSTPTPPEASMRTKPKEGGILSSISEATTASKPSDISPAKSSKPTDKRLRPSKLDITAVNNAPNKEHDSSTTAEVASGPLPSQPPTPATAVSQTSASSAVRSNQARPNRAHALPKAEPIPASPTGVPTISGKSTSRRPSVTSIDRPGTPASEKTWDDMSFATLSRANSPPPSKVGSAPVRQFTKSQQKKERQARAKQAEEATKVEEPPAKTVEPMQAPIIGRKKKAKKEKTQGTADSTPTATRPTSPVPKEEEPIEDKPGPVTPVKENKKPASKVTAESKEPDTPSSPATPASNDHQRASLSAASIFAGLLKSGELSSTVSELFKSFPGLNHRFEGLELDLTGADDSMVSDSQMHSLDQGEAITIRKSSNNHVVVLPDRSALRGLTATQAARYLELRKQALADGDVPSNQALTSLVPVLPQVSLPVARFTSRNPSEDQKLPNHFATPTAGSTPLSAHMQKYGAIEGHGHDGAPGKRTSEYSVEQAESNLTSTRKETEVLEKRLNALMKKNRRLLFGHAH